MITWEGGGIQVNCMTYIMQSNWLVSDYNQNSTSVFTTCIMDPSFQIKFHKYFIKMSYQHQPQTQLSLLQQSQLEEMWLTFDQVHDPVPC